MLHDGVPKYYNRGKQQHDEGETKMVQQTFTDMEYANRNRTTKREAFLDAMESIIPWKEWMELIAPFYVQKERGRK